MSRVSIKGVVVGGIVDVVATNVLAFPIVLIAMARVHASHLPREQVSAALLALLHSDPGLRAAQLLLGGLCSVLGGYLAGWMAKHDEILNGAGSSFLCVAFGVYSLIVGRGPVDGFHVVLLVVSPTLGALGGYLRTLGSSGKTTVAG